MRVSTSRGLWWRKKVRREMAEIGEMLFGGWCGIVVQWKTPETYEGDTQSQLTFSGDQAKLPLVVLSCIQLLKILLQFTPFKSIIEIIDCLYQDLFEKYCIYLYFISGSIFVLQI